MAQGLGVSAVPSVLELELTADLQLLLLASDGQPAPRRCSWFTGVSYFLVVADVLFVLP